MSSPAGCYTCGEGWHTIDYSILLKLQKLERRRSLTIDMKVICSKEKLKQFFHMLLAFLYDGKGQIRYIIHWSRQQINLR